MRLLPANLAEVKEWAKALHTEFVRYAILGRPGPDGGRKTPTLQQTQDILAKCLAYKDWHELSQSVSKPHRPAYLNEFSPADDRLASALGVAELTRYMQDAWMFAWIGYDAKTRKAFASEYISDPEDKDPELYDADSIYGDGVWTTKVGGEVGTELSPERQAMMPVHLRLPRPFYSEESGADWTLPFLAFAEEIPDSVVGALRSLGLISASESAAAGRLADLEPGLAATATYLAQCVATNRRPVAEPTTASGRLGADLPTGEATSSSVTDAPSLDAWWRALMTAEVDGLVPFGPAPWMKHFGYWERRLGNRLR